MRSETGDGALGDHWTAEYENIMEFYFWEPKHLNRVSPPPEQRRPVNEVLGALMKREVPLNHQLNIFFRLAPRGLIRRWLGSILPGLPLVLPGLTDPLAYRGSQAFGACQADLWFEDREARVFVELKVDARSSLQQLCKYALLASALDRSHGPKPCGLVFMGPSRARFDDMVAHTSGRAAANFAIPPSVLKHAARLAIRPEDVVQAVRSMEIGYADYRSFDAFLNEEARGVADVESGETLSRLIAGMRALLAAGGLS